jgi:hypothetical protein
MHRQIGYLLDHSVFRRFGVEQKGNLAKCNDANATGHRLHFGKFYREILMRKAMTCERQCLCASIAIYGSAGDIQLAQLNCSAWLCCFLRRQRLHTRQRLQQ